MDSAHIPAALTISGWRGTSTAVCWQDMPGELPSSVVAEIIFIGRGGGLVKALRGFKKTHHTVPDAASAITNAFLGKICEAELVGEAEQLFQDVRTALGYKRKDISLSVASPLATLIARDFVVEIVYALEEANPARFTVITTLRELRSMDLALTAEFCGIFTGRFSELGFGLKKGARVEAVIDAIETLDGSGGLAVTYPSDYSDCVIRTEGVDAEVRCTGAALEIVFPRAGSPAELIAAFAALREAFQINQVLAGLIG